MNNEEYYSRLQDKLTDDLLEMCTDPDAIGTYRWVFTVAHLRHVRRQRPARPLRDTLPPLPASFVPLLPPEGPERQASSQQADPAGGAV